MSDYKFHEPGEAPSKIANQHADAFVSGAFLGGGNTLDNVEAGLSQQMGSGHSKSTHSQTRAPQSSMCAQCSKPIVGQVFELQGKRLHLDCVPVLDQPCDECHRIILRPPYMTSPAGKHFHNECWEQRNKYRKSVERITTPMAKMTVEDPAAEEERRRIAAKLKEGKEECGACKKIISGMALQFDGRSYCATCLLCSKCKAPLLDRAFDSNRVCAQCQNLPSCAGCNGQLAAGAYVKATEGTVYHPECFNCELCSCNLRGKPFGMGYGNKGGKPRCGVCVNKK
jgi:hypothetical protein